MYLASQSGSYLNKYYGEIGSYENAGDEGEGQENMTFLSQSLMSYHRSLVRRVC